MVAVLHPEALQPRARQPRALYPTPVRPGGVNRRMPGDVEGDRPRLTLLPGGAEAAVVPTGLRGRLGNGLDAESARAVRASVVVAVVLFAGFLGLRTVRTAGLAAATTDGPAANVGTPAAVTVAPGEVVYVVRSGDSLWSIASGLAPDRDPRPLVDELARRNGGTTIETGQRLVLPSQG